MKYISLDSEEFVSIDLSGSHQWFTSQTPVAPEAAPSCSWELGTRSGFPQGGSQLWPCRVCLSGTESQELQPGVKARRSDTGWAILG